MSASNHRLRRLGIRLLLGLAGLLLLGTGTLTALTATPAGSRWLVRQASEYAPAALDIEHIGGTLLEGMRFEGIAYRDDAIELTIRQLTVAWRPAALLRGVLRLTRLDIQGVRYREVAPAPDTGAPLLPERIALPLAIILDDGRISDLQADIGAETHAIDTLSLSATAGPLRGLVVKQFSIRAGDTGVELSGHAGLEQPYPFRCQLRWHTRLPDAVAASGKGSFEGDLQRIGVEHHLEKPFDISTRGDIRLQDAEPVVDLSGQWQELHWPLTGTADYTSARGDYRIQGAPDRWRATIAGDLEGKGVPPMQLHARGHGDRQRADIESLLIQALDGKLSATGKLAWEPALRLDFDIEASDIDPGVQWPAWPGRLGFATRLQLEDRKGIAVSLQGLDLKGRLRDHPVEARGALQLHGDVLAARALSIVSGNNRILLSGELGRGAAMDYRVRADDLAALLPGLAGRLEASGRLQGTLEHPSGTIELEAGELARGDTLIRALTMQATLDPGRPQVSVANIEAQGVGLGSQEIDSVTIEARGWMQAHRVSMQLAAAVGTAQLELRGGYRPEHWTGHLNRATLELRELGEWRLAKAVPLSITADSVKPARACWVSLQREVCLDVRRKRDRARLGLAGKAPEGRLRGDIELSRLDSTAPAIAGEIELEVPDLAALDPLLPELQLVAGSLNLRTRLTGSLDAPVVSGQADIERGSLRVAQLGVEIDDIELRGRAEGGRLQVEAGARSDEGTIGLDGEIALAPERDWPFRFSLEGKRFAVARLPDVEIDASPDLNIKGSLQRVDVSGSVLIPRARVELKKLPAGVVRLSPDQVIVGQAQQTSHKAERKIPVAVNITAILGEDVHFKGLGLTTDLAGSVNLRSRRNRTLSGNGILELRNGLYDGYGQKLVIRRGRLLFAGPLDDPSLDIRATRTIGDVVAGLEVSGRASAPRLTLFSEPPMPDAEIMSWLVTGKPLDAQSGGSDSQALAAAAASLGANNPVAQEISRELGIELGVESGTGKEEDTSLMVGKKLSPKLQLNYLYGLFTEAGSVQLIYRLSRHLSLTGQTGAEQSIDLNLGIDRP